MCMASENHHVKGQRKSCQTFSSALSSAASEWLLILLLYLDGLFSYLITKLVHRRKLQAPCLLCSRLDNILGHERPGFYKDLVCHAHKLEISSLAYCPAHHKLADIREMCEACLLSFTTEKKSNHETYRLAGKLERNLVNAENVHLSLPATVDTDVKFQGENVVEAPLLKKGYVLESPRTRYCSCCNELFHKKLHAQRLLQTKSIGPELVECGNASLGQVGNDGLHHQKRMNAEGGKSLLLPSASPIGGRGFDRLSHIGYTELKITSDSESEVPFSDDDDGNAPVGLNDLKEEPLPGSLKQEKPKSDQTILPKTLMDDSKQEKLVCATSTLPGPSHLETLVQLHVAEHHDDDSSMPEVKIIRGLEELNWNEFGGKSRPSTPSKLIFQNTENFDEAEGKANAHYTTAAQGSENHPALPEDKLEISRSKSGEVETGDGMLLSSTTYLERLKDLNSTGTDMKQIQRKNKPGSLTANHLNLNDAHKLAIGYKMDQPSPRTHENLRLFLSQISAARGFELPWNDASPRVNGQGDDLKVPDASSTINQQSFFKRSVERNECGFEPFDGSIVSEIEGEDLIDRLKQQIEIDRKSMSLLYKELEEERNASAIAANQAMAMITRLQEEKAAMQMEALQYLRMMEEQAEYDQEALQKSNDHLTEKEKEIQDLEAEIESYKRRLGEEPFPTKVNGVPEEREDSPVNTEEREDNLADEPRRLDRRKILKRSNTVFMDAEGDEEEILEEDSSSDS